jgi:uncharacterized protein (DUF2141 family)
MSLLVLFCGCAQQGILTGGEKDIMPPSLMFNKDTLAPIINFSGNEFQLVFNENIQYLNNNKSILINPSIKEKEISVAKNILSVKWLDTLSQNTTYSFIFNNSIADLTEKNIVKTLHHTFSTGKIIDSGRINGTIVTLPRKDFGKELLVEIKDKINSQKVYTAYADKSGYFNIENIKKGDYTLNYYLDNNNDFELDTLKDLQGFYDNFISINDSSKLNFIYAFEPSQNIKLENTSLSPTGKLELEFNQAIDSCKIFDTINQELYLSHARKKKHQFYLKDTANKFLVIINAKKFCDTLRIASNIKGGERLLNFQKKGTLSLNYSPIFVLNFNQFINYVDSSKMILIKDSAKAPYEIYYIKNELRFNPTDGAGNYLLKLFPSSVKGIVNEKTDTSIIHFNLRSKEELSTIELKIRNINHTHSILQLHQNNNLMKEFSFEGSYIDTNFENCLPGSYQLRLIQDLDKNKYWTTGDFKEKRQPEKVYNYNDEIILKKNWTSSYLWDLNIQD